MNWFELERLRSRFLAESFSAVSHYWNSAELISEYDATFAERIGWKWDAVYSELIQRGWSPPQGEYTVLDWGCGTGIAARKFLKDFLLGGSKRLPTFHFYDKSRECTEFALTKVREFAPTVKADSWSGVTDGSPLVLLLSHVLNELDENALAELHSLCKKANKILWVEPGSFEVSRKLIEQRELLRSEFSVFAPCTHQQACGMLDGQNGSHWCHHFATPPSSVFQDRFWGEFSKKLKIDLHSLPVSFLALEKKSAEMDSPVASPITARVIGRPRLYKGNGKFLLCQRDGVKDTTLLERKHKELFKRYKKDRFCEIMEPS